MQICSHEKVAFALLDLFWTNTIQPWIITTFRSLGVTTQRLKPAYTDSMIFKWKNEGILLLNEIHDERIFYTDEAFMSHGLPFYTSCNIGNSSVSGKCILFFCKYVSMAFFYKITSKKAGSPTANRVLQSVTVRPPPLLTLYTHPYSTVYTSIHSIHHPWFFSMGNLQSQDKFRHHLFINSFCCSCCQRGFLFVGTILIFFRMHACPLGAMVRPSNPFCLGHYVAIDK